MPSSAKRILRDLHSRKLIFFLSIILIFTLTTIALWIGKPEKIKIESADKAFEIAQEINNQCHNDASNRCFESFFRSFARSHEFRESKIILDKLQEINPKIKYCHFAAHVISIAEVEKDPSDWLKVFAYVPDAECSYGFYHGVIEGAYQFNPQLDVDSDLVEKVCLSVIKNSRSQRSCIHAFGHIILVHKDGDLSNALSICNQLETSSKSPCYQGVFMENIQKSNLSAHKIERRPNWDELYLENQIDNCRYFKGLPYIECWRSLGPVINAVTDKDANESMDYCKKSNFNQSEQACVRDALGGIMIDLFSNNQQPTSDLCAKFEGDDKYQSCLQGIIDYVLLTSKEFRSQMSDYCLLLSAEHKDSCLEVIERVQSIN